MCFRKVFCVCLFWDYFSDQDWWENGKKSTRNVKVLLIFFFFFIWFWTAMFLFFLVPDKRSWKCLFWLSFCLQLRNCNIGQVFRGSHSRPLLKGARQQDRGEPGSEKGARLWTALPRERGFELIKCSTFTEAAFIQQSRSCEMWTWVIEEIPVTSHSWQPHGDASDWL